jgi:hypothetical protein
MVRLRFVQISVQSNSRNNVAAKRQNIHKGNDVFSRLLSLFEAIDFLELL